MMGSMAAGMTAMKTRTGRRFTAETILFVIPKTIISTTGTEPITVQEKMENGTQKTTRNGTMEKINSQERKTIN